MIDCKMKCSRFIGSVNRVMANFGHLQSHILSQIFKTHCCTFYGSALWYFNSEGFAKICTTLNKVVRTILKLPIRAHTYLRGPLLNQQNIYEQLYVRSIRCLYTMYHSSNYIVRTVFNNALYNSNSCIGYKMATLEILMQLILLSMIQVLFFHALKLLAHIIILSIMQLLTIY